MVTQCHRTTTFEERKAEAESNRGPCAYQPNALPLGQAGSHSRFSVQPSRSSSLSRQHPAHRRGPRRGPQRRQALAKSYYYWSLLYCAALCSLQHTDCAHVACVSEWVAIAHFLNIHRRVYWCAVLFAWYMAKPVQQNIIPHITVVHWSGHY